MARVRNNPFPSFTSKLLFAPIFHLPPLNHPLSLPKQSIIHLPIPPPIKPPNPSQCKPTKPLLLNFNFGLHFLFFLYSHPRMTSEQAAVQTQTPLTLSKYSNRVILKAILGRSDGGIGLVGERVVIGGWVRSSKELRKEPPAPAPAGPASGDAQGQGDSNISCVEIIQNRIPFFRSIMKVLGGVHFPGREKPDFAVQKPQQPPPPSTAVVRISDGSCISYLQALVDSSIAPPNQILPTGTCVLVEGVLQQPATEGKHAIELKVDGVMHIGMVNQDRYPLSKKRLPMDMLRDFPHFRPRTTTVASVARIRDCLHQAIQTFFVNNGFLCVQVPIITTTDSEGFTEKFQVTTLLESKGKKEEPFATVDTRGANPETVEPSVKEESKQLQKLERTESNWEKLIAALEDLRETNKQQAAQLEAIQKSKSPTSVKTDTVDFSEDFFSCQTYLTASGRLHLESYARALGNVYSFGPRFRAQKMESKTQVAEMWMLELEMAFSQLKDAMDCADDFLKFTSKWVLENCLEDLKFLSKRVDQTIVDRLQSMASNLFPRISYAEALELLKQAKEKKFTANIKWGMSLTEEHESYLANEFYGSPFIIHNYPKELKPFYVRLNSDGKTVAAFDLVVPKAGTLIRGSQNEERLNVLTTRIKELGLQKGQYEWYLDLRRHGTVTSCGFSLAFDLLLSVPLALLMSGMSSLSPEAAAKPTTELIKICSSSQKNPLRGWDGESYMSHLKLCLVQYWLYTDIYTAWKACICVHR